MRAYILVVLLLTTSLFSGEYQVDKQADNLVKFISDAPFENFEGITNRIGGYLYYGDTSLTNNSQIYMEVDLNSLDTGIGLRNRHMRENYLKTDEFPITWFKGKIISSRINADSSYEIQAQGTIFIHGVEKELQISAELRERENGYRIHTTFQIKLSDFKIDIPSIMFYKINEMIELQIDFYLKEVD